MALPRQVKLSNSINGINESVPVNVYDIKTKEIVFSGSQCAAARFLNVPVSNLSSALIRKWNIKRQFAIRIKSTKTNDND